MADTEKILKAFREHAEDRERARFEEPFLERVERARAQHEYQRAIERQAPEIAARHAPKTRVEARLDGPRSLDDAREVRFSAETYLEQVRRWREAAVDERETRMRFTGGNGRGGLAPVAPISGVANGRVGWADQLTVENDSAGTQRSGLFMGWAAEPFQADGEYRFTSNHPFVRVVVDFQLEGSGLWGLDTMIQVTTSSFFSISGPIGIRDLVSLNELVLYADRTRWFSGQTLGPATTFFDVPRQADFYAYEGETAMYGMALSVVTFADDATARFAVRDFWVPSVDPDREVFVRARSTS